MSEIPVDFPHEPDPATDDTVEPYADLPLRNGVGFQDPEAVVLDPDVEGEATGRARAPKRAGAVRRASARVGAAAASWARKITRWSPSGMCQQFTRSCFNVGAYYGTAALAWHRADHKHPTSLSRVGGMPPNVPVFWTGGSRGAGHAAYHLGHGLVRSTDWPRSGQVGTVHIATLTRAWGHSFQGWTEDINNVRVWEPEPTRTLDLSTIQRATRRGKDVPQGAFLKKAVAAEVGKGAMNLSTKTLGSGFKTQYRKVQREYIRSQGGTPTAKTADGIPGGESLRWLGRRQGFKVTA